MREREPDKETIGRGELLFLMHPGPQTIFSGYGLTVAAGRKDRLVGLIMVDRPRLAPPGWLQRVALAFGECQLVPLTAGGERGLACQMQIGPESLPLLRQLPADLAGPLQAALQPLLAYLPTPSLRLSWDGEAHLWRGELATDSDLAPELRAVFLRLGYGSLAVETPAGVVHVCHAPDADVASFAGQPAVSRWQLVRMPTAPLIRLEVAILDDPRHPFRFESFLNVADAEQARILAQLANQEVLYLAFYSDDLHYRYTMTIPHTVQQWQRLDELVEAAARYWAALPEGQRDFDLAKATFMALSAGRGC